MKYYEVRFHIEVPSATMLDDARDVLSALAGEAGFETFEENEDGLTGYIQQSLFNEDTLKEQLMFFPFEDTNISYEVSEAEDRDWNAEWEQEGFEPIVINNRCIIHDGRHLNGLNPSDFEHHIEIDAHLAFGTGTHETTRMMVSTLLSLDLKGKRVLDCGCGTGILSLVALQCGANHCDAYDIDEWSVENTRHNAVINRLDSNLTVAHGDAFMISTFDTNFDVVIANINRNILLNDMPAFCSAMAPGATLLLSGFYTEDINILQEKASEFSLQLVSQKEENNWACIALKHTE